MMDITGIGSVLDFGGKLIDRIWPDPAQRDAAKLELFKAQQAGEFKAMDQAFESARAQIGVNAVEAASPNLFTSGWRPAIGWVCGAALSYTYLIYPLLTWACAIWWPAIKPPVLGNDGMLYELLLGMLGLGGLRSWEKIKGVAK